MYYLYSLRDCFCGWFNWFGCFGQYPWISDCDQLINKIIMIINDNCGCLFLSTFLCCNSSTIHNGRGFLGSTRSLWWFVIIRNQFANNFLCISIFSFKSVEEMCLILKTLIHSQFIDHNRYNTFVNWLRRQKQFCEPISEI